MRRKTVKKHHLIRNLLLGLIAVAMAKAATTPAALAESDHNKVTILTEYGPVCGETLENGTSRWLGIPYAAAPVGELRFKAPRNHEPWMEPLAATEKAKDPMQAAALTDETKYSEDCLYLNVYKPDTEETGLPVLVFIYGGSYESGGSSSFNFEAMAKETDAIIVCFNYRVGPFGFLNFSDLSDKFEDNLGMKDILFALRWVNRNIEAFGGNPGNVTIWGQSAGAGAVAVMLQCTEARDYFQKAIIMSNCWESYYTAEQGRILRDRFLEAAGIAQDDLDSLLDLAPAEILKAAGSLEGFGEFGATLFRPIADGEIFSAAPLQADTSDIHIPILIGTTNDEATLFLNALSEKDIKEMLASGVKILHNVDDDQQNEIFSTYEGYPSKKAAIEIVTDLVYKVPASRYANKYAENAPVWFYRYDAYPVGFGLLGLRSFHACDLLMLCGNLSTGRAGHLFNQYIGNFLHHGDPNGDGLVLWNRYTEDQRHVLILNNKAEEALNPYGSILEKYEGIEHLLIQGDE